MPDPASILLDALAASADPPTLAPLLLGIRDVLAQAGVTVERVQIPLNRMSGFRHPTLGLVLATWSDDQGVEVELVTHDRLDALPTHGAIDTPFGPIVMGETDHLTHTLPGVEHNYAILNKLRDRGYTSYCAVGLPVPTGAVQPMSLASRESLGDADVETILGFCPLFSLAVYAAYRTSQAYRVAESYIGPSAGPQVLAGDIKRGSTHAIDAGIVFCDIRGFTPLSARLGAQKVVEVVNEVFANVGKAIEAYERLLLPEPAPFDRFVAALKVGAEALRSGVAVGAEALPQAEGDDGREGEGGRTGGPHMAQERRGWSGKEGSWRASVSPRTGRPPARPDGD